MKPAGRGTSAAAWRRAWSAQPSQSVVLRTVWRVKKTPLGSSGNTRPDYQQLLTGVEALIWCDSFDESPENGATLEERVATAIQSPHTITRFGGLALGESTHLVDEACLIDDRTRAIATGKGALVPAASNRPLDFACMG